MSEENRTDALRAAAEKRFELKRTVSEVEMAMAAPAADPAWRGQLIGRLEDLSEALMRHVEAVEAKDGLLCELLTAQPRLANQISQVRAEHPLLCRHAAEVLANLERGAEVDSVRTEVLELLSAVVRHRQRGADLVYEGYEVDIGGGG